MSTAFHISPGESVEASRLKIDLADYKAKLLERWPDLKFIDPINLLLSCILPNSAEGVAGLIVHLVSEDSIAMELGHGFYEFILWHRKYVSSEHRLFLWAAHDPERDFELKYDTSENEIREFAGIMDD